MLPWLICAVLAVAVAVLAIKIRIMQKSMDEICACLAEHLSSDTNRLISVSSGDKYVRRLAGEISRQLAELRRQRLKYIGGDRELKEAVTNISHDLRTPLTAICGYIDLLEPEEMTENTKRYLAQIKGRTEALKSLTEELFRYSVVSSVSEMNYENVNVGKALEEALLSFYGAFGQKNITPQISLPEDAVVRTLDAAALSRVFENIIGNALKYSDGDFYVTMEKTGKITFSNTSAALSSVDVGKLFDRFFTVDSARKTTGLGLSIAKLLTERMGGTIFAEYKESKISIVISFN
jgi:signal transduction histidine kinase